MYKEQTFTLFVIDERDIMSLLLPWFEPRSIHVGLLADKAAVR
jgi:hypothetical protein